MKCIEKGGCEGKKEILRTRQSILCKAQDQEAIN
jgi:hypothetical protein